MKNPAAAVALALACAAGCVPRSGPAAAGLADYDPKAGLPGAVQARYDLALDQPEATFFDQPWPSDLRRKPTGHIILDRFPGQNGFFNRYISLAARTLRGASLSPTIYTRFTGPIPAPGTPERSPRAPVFLMDIDPASPEYGVLWPVTTQLARANSRFVPPGTLEVRLVPGFVLRPLTLYALVVRRDLTTPPLGTPLSFEATKSTRPRSDPREEVARQNLAFGYAALAKHGVAHGEVASMTTFRTSNPRTFTIDLLAHAASLRGAAAPRLLWARWEPSLGQPQGPAPYLALRGMYCTPNYQRGVDQAPFLQDGGEIAVGEDEGPVLAPIPPGSRYHDPACGPLLRSRFVMTVPLTPPPAEGYPLVISAHGTGGDARTFLGANDFAGWAASQGVAVVSTDQPLHGAGGEAPRPGSDAPIKLGILGISLPSIDPPMLFYNPLNPAAARDNLRQATVDAASLIRLFAGLDLAASGAWQPSPGEPAPPRLRADRVALAGHSQGSQSLAVLGAVDPRVRGVLLSGCGGDSRYGVLANKEFDRFRGIVESLIGLAPGELDEFHPFLALVQWLSDPIDPQSWASLYREPLVGTAPRSVLHFEGLGDGYNPNVAAEALAVALRASPLAPLPKPLPTLDLLGLKPSPAVGPTAAGGQATLAFVQLAPTRGEDGHFVIYSEPGAGPVIQRFFADIAAGRAPQVRW